MDIEDKVFQLENEFTNTLKKFKKKYLFPETHLQNAIATYISSKDCIDGSSLSAANVLLFLYEAFKCMKDAPNSELPKHDYNFPQKRKQIAMNVNISVWSVDTILTNLENAKLLTKTKKGKDGPLTFTWNYENMIEMLRFVGKEHLVTCDDKFKGYQKEEKEKKVRAEERKEERNDRWNKINNDLHKPFNAETYDLLAKYDIDVKQADIMSIICRGLLFYRNTLIRWNDANFNTIFGENSTYSFSYDPASNDDLNKLFEACNPKYETTKKNVITPRMHIINKICNIYKNLKVEELPKKPTFDDAYLDEITEEYIKEKSVKVIE